MVIRSAATTLPDRTCRRRIAWAPGRPPDTARSVSAQAAETDVEPGAHDAGGLLDVDQSRAQPGQQRRQRNPAGAVVVIAVFDEAGEHIREGIFAADADGPSRARFGPGIDGPEDDGRGRVIVALPGAAAPDIAEEAIPGVANTTGDRRQRLGLTVIGDAELARAAVAAGGIGPGIVAHDADHEA